MNPKTSTVVNVIKRGELLVGTIYRDASNGAFPYWGEVKHGDETFLSTNYMDEDYVEQWIDQKFNTIIGRK